MQVEGEGSERGSIQVSYCKQAVLPLHCPPAATGGHTAHALSPLHPCLQQHCIQPTLLYCIYAPAMYVCYHVSSFDLVEPYTLH